MRALGGAAEPEAAADPIICHASVRAMLLAQKAYAEGAFALCLEAADLHERASHGDADARALLEVQTEIVKSWPSEWCLEGNKLAMQVLGGAGYVRDWPLEQLYRDNRLVQRDASRTRRGAQPPHHSPRSSLCRT